MRPPGVEGHLPHMLTPPGTRGFPTSARPKLAMPSACVMRAFVRGVASARACTCSYARAGPARDNTAWAGRALEADQNTVVCVLVDCCKITCGCIKQYTV